MKKKQIFINTVYIVLLFVGSSLYGLEPPAVETLPSRFSEKSGVGEKTLLLGGSATWKTAETRIEVTEVRDLRPNPVLILSSATGTSDAGYSAAKGALGNYAPLTESALDLSLSFDESSPSLFKDSAGYYSVTVSPEVESVERRFARAGTGAALFSGTGASSNFAGPIIIMPNNTRNALFTAGNHIRDFTIEFWLYPLNMENGEELVSWISSRPKNGDYSIQRIHCTAVRNRLQWTFQNFFASTDDTSHLNIELSGTSTIVPKTWTHHLIRFDATTGMIEYLVNGSSEAIVYATMSGREGGLGKNGEIYTPIAGTNGVFVLGERFLGMMDEFKIHSVCAGRASIQKYSPAGGRVETRAIDLGENNSGLVKIEASGGRAGIKGTIINNEFKRNGRFKFNDDSEMQFFIRAGSNPFNLNNQEWISFIPGDELIGVSGRYAQLAFNFYPSADGENCPYLDEVSIIYLPGDPPLPPQNLTATAVDSGVILRWKQSPDINTDGYLVYYSTVRGELFGNDSGLGPSPIDVGNRNTILIDGLKNGTLYFFRVASYDRVAGQVSLNEGEFSREVTARPLAGLLISGLSLYILEDN